MIEELLDLLLAVYGRIAFYGILAWSAFSLYGLLLHMRHDSRKGGRP